MAWYDDTHSSNRNNHSNTNSNNNSDNNTNNTNSSGSSISIINQQHIQGMPPSTFDAAPTPTLLRRASRISTVITHAFKARASSLIFNISSTSVSMKSGYNAEAARDDGETGGEDNRFPPPTSNYGDAPQSPLSPDSPTFQDSRLLPSRGPGGFGGGHHDHHDRASTRANVGGQRRDERPKLRSNKIQQHISHQSPHVWLLRIAWLVALFVGEHGVYWSMIRRCAWPENSSWDQSHESMRERYRVAIVADPQLTDWMSYHQSGLLLALVETYTDIFMKRSFSRLHASLQPDAVLFLGDLNDGGRLSHGDVFKKNKWRFFEHVFDMKATAWNQNPLVMDNGLQGTFEDYNEEPLGGAEEEASLNITGHYRQLRDIPLDATEREAMRRAGRSVRLYVAGNHDVGFGNTLIKQSMKRYKQVFGSVNYEVQVGNHSIVVLDTLALSSERQDIREESQQFLTQVKNARETKQLILNRAGEQYQNMVNASLSGEILRSIQPDMVFSGDDHDWCEVAHSWDKNWTPEVTLPTFSFAQGIQQAGFVMLSLYNPEMKIRNELLVVPVNSNGGLPVSSEGSTVSVGRPSKDTTFVYEECMLPNQMMIYLSYGVVLAITLNWILVQRYRWVVQSHRHWAAKTLLARWRRTSYSMQGQGGAGGVQDVIIPQGSTTATALPPLPPPVQEQRYFLGDSQIVGGEADETGNDDEGFSFEDPGISTTNRGKKTKALWPLFSKLYWKMVGWDVWNIVRFVIPFYVLLFVITII
ncbi:hypothetical protein EDD11_001962 [Mortierella claussenii]|nr:hypothetical protein EDD11_001962 [Mortierella claussenii]